MATGTSSVNAPSVGSTPTFTEFALPSGSRPQGIAVGSDGALWIAEAGTKRIARMTTDGTVTEFALPATSEPQDIAAGPDGSLWFTEFDSRHIGRITTAGVVTEFATQIGAVPSYGITAGPDGALWYAVDGANTIGRITTDGHITTFSPSTVFSNPVDIAAGPDGALWFTEFSNLNGGTNAIGRITTTGLITLFPLPSFFPVAWGITAGSDGAMWFTERRGRIGRITTAGVITEFESTTLSEAPIDIAAGPDGALWFTHASGIGRITTAGVMTDFTVPTANSAPWAVTAGPDGNIWFTEGAASKVGRLTLGDDPNPKIALDWTADDDVGTMLNAPLVVRVFCSPGLDASAGVTEYLWHVESPAHAVIETRPTRDCSLSLVLDATKDEGVYPTRVDALKGTTVLASAHVDVIVQDFLTVSIGDSVGSGEGNPDRGCAPGSCIDPRSSPAVWEEPGCHRSHFAGSAVAPLMVESFDPRSSVSLLHIACSGASTSNGLLGSYDGIDGKRDYPPQVQQIETALAGREIDALLVSVGGNDIGFSHILKDCAWGTDCVARTAKKLPRDISRLDTQLFALNACLSSTDARCQAMLTKEERKGWGSPIKSLGIDPERVFITTYFDPTRDQNGTQCQGIFFQTVGAGITPAELTYLSDTVIPALNDEIRLAAKLYGWTPVDGADQAFKTHGYCANDTSRWIRTFAESAANQGDTNGTMHPTVAGHEWYGARLFDALSAKLFDDAGLPRLPR